MSADNASIVFRSVNEEGRISCVGGQIVARSFPMGRLVLKFISLIIAFDVLDAALVFDDRPYKLKGVPISCRHRRRPSASLAC